MKQLVQKLWQGGIIFVIATMLFAGLLQLFGVYRLLELKSYDLRFRLRGNRNVTHAGIVLVTIDDQSFLSLKSKWPFQRPFYARAILNLFQAGAALVVLDIELTEPSNLEPNDDVVLAQVIRHFPRVILAGKLIAEYGNNDVVNRYVLKPLSEFLSAGAHWGFANVFLDEDGFIRRYCLFQDQNNTRNFPLAIEVLRYLQKLTPKDIVRDADHNLKVGKYSIPIVGADAMLINYAGPAGHFPTYSFANVLDDARYTLPDSAEDTDIFEVWKSSGVFKNKIVFIGASADELQDNKYTPYFNQNGVKRKMPGVEVHANALHTILSRDFIRPLNPWLILFIIVCLSVIAFLLTSVMRPFLALIGAAGTIFGYLVLSYWLFSEVNRWVPIVYPIINFSLCYAVNLVFKIVQEHQEKNRFRNTFQQYVARNVVESMLSTGELPKFGGERKRLTVMFSDIRSFTTYTEKYPPEVVVQRLSEYLSSMVDVIFDNGGTLDKFVGDEIMAIYGAPYYYPDHALRACQTALDMIAELRRLQKNWSAQEIEYFQIGIGINTGNVIVGNLGSIQLFDYTVIGDEVNLGARLEGANKHYSTSIIISESTYNEVKDQAIVRELDYVRVKGKRHPVRIYELRGMHSVPSIEKELIIDVYHYALQLFRQRRWNRALKEFRRILRYFPSDGPSRVYTLRCLDFIQNPPAEDWDGVFEFAFK
ncbi:MAG: adenylate/guanylate cyclase domain-containing protein [candidate division KSB1 bacterium]|nr:adenylate/guanylate cyclase domain-containing protein [candidate division KSB1 bacterium]